MTIGMENLPNVFIDKIDLHPLVMGQQLVGYRIDVKLCMYDHSPKRSWYGRDDLNDMLVKLAFRGGEAASALDNGEDSLYDHSPQDYGIFLASPFDFEIEEELDGYTKFFKTIQFETRTPSNLNVYAACFIDGLQFGNSLFNKFYGPMAAEKIIVGGLINEDSGYFYYPDTNEEYAGPVHGHNETFMEGSKHNDQPHATLRYVVEDNYKIRMPTFDGPAASGDPDQTDGVAELEDPTSNTDIGEAGEATPQEQGVNLGEATLTTPGGISVQAGLAQADTAGPPELTQRPQAQDLLADVNFEIRDAIRRGIYNV